MLTFPKLLADLRQNPQREVLRFGGRIYCAAEISDDIAETAGALSALGVTKGDRICVWMVNCPHWIVIQMACAAMGAVLIPIQPRYGITETLHIIRTARPTVLFIKDRFRNIDFRRQVFDIRASLTDEERRTAPRVVCIGGGDAPDIVPWTSFLARGEGARRADVTINPDDPAVCIFTSGTTGFPKGAILSHRAILATEIRVGDILRLGPEDRVHYAAPLASVFGCCNALNAAWTHGASLVLLETFDPGESLKVVERERCTAVYGVPAMFLMQLEHPRFPMTDCSSLRTGIIGGAPASPELIDKIIRLMGVRDLISAYGMSETCAVATMTRIGDNVDLVSRTVGRPLPDVEVRIVDKETGNRLPQEHAGEIQVRGCNVMSGYLGNREATSAAFTADGWLRTGDVGRITPEGYLQITGRSSDMFLVGGFNVYPAEVEYLLSCHPNVAEAHVVGVPDERLGQIGMAFVRLSKNKDLTKQELIDFCDKRIANYKVPRYVVFIDEFPLTPLGKVHKSRLREMAEAQIEAQQSS